MALGDVLNLRDADLLPVLRLLTKKDKVDFSKVFLKAGIITGLILCFVSEVKPASGWKQRWLQASEKVFTETGIILKRTDWSVSK